MTTDTASLLARVDLAALIEADLGPLDRRAGGWLYWLCPFHSEKTPSFGVKAGGGRFYCFGCGKHGDAVTWLREYRGLSFGEAVRALGGEVSAQRAAPRPAALPKEKAYPDQWQAQWKAVIQECEQVLWSPAGARALEWLHGRGLKDETLRSPFFRVGYCPGAVIEGVKVDRGITLPCFTITSGLDVDYIYRVKVRRPAGEPKYKNLPGSVGGLYGAQAARGADVLFLCEGELDALLLSQRQELGGAGDLVGAVTLGAATDRLDFARWGQYLLPAKALVCAYDNDPAGEDGAAYWQGLSERVKRARIPEPFKDVTEYYQGGGDLAAWVMETLRALEVLNFA